MSENVEVVTEGENLWTLEFPSEMREVEARTREELISKIKEVARELGYRKVKANIDSSRKHVKVTPVEEAGV